MNKCMFIGNLTHDVTIEKVRVANEEVSLAKISLALNSKDKDKEATFVDIAVWRNNAENLAKFNKKGSKLFIEAEISNNNYEKDGVKHYGYKFNAVEVEFLSNKKE